MMLIYKIVTLLATIVFIVWAINEPGYESIGGALVSFGALVAVFFIDEKRKSAAQSQTVAAGGKGIQVGGDANNSTFH
jgi:F0F1-type ATP synthase assembly protein I